MKPIAAPILCAARVLLGAVFVYMGLVKVLDPVAFLKLVQAYHLIDTAPLLNVIAAVVPWFEVFCGVLLIAGFKARPTALLQVLVLVGFTGAIAARGIAVARTGAVPFWSVRFDCGCGSGEVLVGLKLLENAGLILLAALIAATPERHAGSTRPVAHDRESDLRRRIP